MLVSDCGLIGGTVLLLAENILRAINYIEENLQNPLTLDMIAEHSHFSKFHFHRMFRAVTGKTVSEYIWKRRLTLGIERLLLPGGSITDIAQEAGFSDSASFSHAFRQYFHLTPSEYRKAPQILPVTQRLTMRHFTESEQGVMAYPETVYMPGFTVIGSRHIIFYGENREKNTAYNVGSNFFYTWREKLPCAIKRELYTGITLLPKEEDYTWYISSFEVAPDAPCPDGLEKLSFPAGYFACFRYAGLHGVELLSQNMRPLFEQIFLNWMPLQKGITIPYNLEHIPWSLCSKNYSQIELYYALQDT